ncbi:MAG: winged helix DNA-binding domain-containing protein [Gammaproteobacteria bacterium]|nr:winged helix DNA-binding domain-containing protein [Gammaproteobacteria bacterium]MBU1775232.1 winged helix DNA-binding domain-containing protein [Gammaproteobacteria bacterium]MBU1969215.1 winged helix DNA-binding domain-containing protein [Gammaproteobacteria bacterium]
MKDIAFLRLIHQQILNTRCRQPHEVVSVLGAIQAQDYAASLWAIGARLPTSTRTDVESAVSEHRIVRTWAMRGTIHLIAAEDVRWMLPLLAPRVLSGAAGRDRQLGLDAATFSRSRKLLEKALQGGKQMPRDEVYAVLESSKISTEGQRGYHILWRLGLEGVVCFGQHEGKQPTFALLDDWVPQSRRLERDAALAELALRYFSSRGPATAQDFATWAKLSLAEARAGLESSAPELQRFTQTGETYWMSKMLAESTDSQTAFLLPAFDEYLLGYKDRNAVLAAEHAGKVVPGGNGMFLPMMVLDGRIVGIWKRTLKKTSVHIDYAPFGKLKKSNLASFDVAAQRYGAFLGLMVE